MKNTTGSSRFFMRFKKIRLFLLGIFLFWNAAWAMTEEERSERKVGFFYLGQVNCERIFRFLSSSDLVSSMLTRNSADEMREAAFHVCSTHPLSINYKNIEDDLLFSIGRGYGKRMKILNLSHSTFNFCMLRELPETLVHLSLDGVRSQNGSLVFIDELLRALPKFKHLKELIFNSNSRITDASMAEMVLIAEVHGITKLHIACDAITDVGASSIAMMPEITDLNLKGNDIGPSGALNISLMEKVTKLHLSGNHVGDVGASCISQMQNVTDLSLAANQITDVGAHHLSRMQAVVNLNLAANQITPVGASHLSRMQRVADLNLSVNQITDIGAVYVSGMQGVVSLALAENRIGDFGARVISQMQGVSILNLSNNQISDDGAASLFGMQGLTVLLLHGNNIQNLEQVGAFP